jgi:phage FluMu protein Com
MPRTIQCQRCGVVLNLPDHVAAGKRLKCPKCATRFVVSEADASSMSTVPGLDDAAATSFDLEKRPQTPDDLPIATSEGDLRETFDLPLSSGRDAERGHAASAPATADAAALFQDHAPAKRRVTAAEARSKARRCVHCGSGVAQGMSICMTCGTDQETGQRVGLDDDLIPAPPPRAQGPPLHIAIIGGLCGTAGIILMLAGAIKSIQTTTGAENLAWLALALVSAFGIFGCVQLIRGKSTRVLMLALTFGAVLDVLGLVAAPLVMPMLEDQDQIVVDIKPKDLDESGVEIKPFEERINTQKIEVGIVVMVLYAGLSLYLMSPSVKRYIFHCRPDRGL